MHLYFSDIFDVPPKILDKYGAFNISLVTDLPLFIDPFLLFNSKKKEYRQLHDDIIKYLRFLKDKSTAGTVNAGLLKSWYHFSEVKENWLGFCVSGNTGRGLGKDFARALNENLRNLFTDFGSESVTKGSHLEKLCLIKDGVGKDTISDFTTNLIKEFLLKYTETFAQKHIDKSLRREMAVERVSFNYETESWQPGVFDLPVYKNKYVLLSPKEILTKDETWINKPDFFRQFDRIPEAIENEQLRAQINNYFYSILPKDPTSKDEHKAAASVALKFPELIDYYIKYKEERGNDAVKKSFLDVNDSRMVYIDQFGSLVNLLSQKSAFYSVPGNTTEEVLQRIEFLKDVVENKGGHKLFYNKGKPLAREKDIQILFKLTWRDTVSDVSREVNDGRGPVDFKIARGSKDKTLVEFKLAGNSGLSRNLQKQLEIYKKASDAKKGYKVIFYFSKQELAKVQQTLKDLNMTDDPYVILVDARKDNKPTGSKA
ncbi:MAG: hypothetical protein A2X59_04915 [Nitrospirae bacterium GWC2_42_7]|nr:MAG: hypothetical protein A2X59_04915 [Nitrospirae bacterium GWC2_42_7]